MLQYNSDHNERRGQVQGQPLDGEVSVAGGAGEDPASYQGQEERQEGCEFVLSSFLIKLKRSHSFLSVGSTINIAIMIQYGNFYVSLLVLQRNAKCLYFINITFLIVIPQQRGKTKGKYFLTVINLHSKEGLWEYQIYTQKLL